MKLIKSSDAAGKTDSSGISGIPSWRRKWIEEQTRKVLLECGCIDDISDPTITFLNTFAGAQIDCAKHNRFVAVIKPFKTECAPIPDNPLF